MNKLEAKILVFNTFEKSFEESRFTLFIRNLFNNFDLSKATGWQQGQYIFSEFRDVVKRFKRIGQYVDNKNNEIDILLINLYDQRTLNRARTKQRDFVAKYLKNKIRPAALAAYYNDDSYTWRFSFVRLDYTLQKQKFGNIKVIPELSPARRYSFLIGKDETNLTAQKQFISLFEKENIALDDIVDTFSIEKVTQEFYKELVSIFNTIKEKYVSGINDDKKISFTQLLLNRLLFIKFLEKKGWLFADKTDNEAERKNYLNKMLEKYKSQNQWSSFFYWLFFHGLNAHSYGNFVITDAMTNKIGYVPFLNGGLFQEAFEKTNGWNDSEVKVDNKAFDLIFDNLLNRFNFTIDENVEDEIEVSLNPDLLGYAYEELIAERHGQGAYYTHPTEVGLMCRESLKTFLLEHSNLSYKQISELIDNKNPIELKEDEAFNIYKILLNIKILDPAIGSGAYPVRMMQELVGIYKALAERISQTDYGLIIQSKLADPGNEYDLKKSILQNNIYGADIDHFAVEIAKLRFWLSLVVDYNKDVNSVDDLKNIPALPNLDFKLRTGDSLLSLIGKSNGKVVNLDSVIKNQNIDAFFSQQIDQLRVLKKTFFNFEELKRSGKIHSDKTKEQFRKEIENFELNIAQSIGIKALDKFHFSHHILWQIHFAEIFESDGTFGFDICIANPPYLRQEKINELFKNFDSSISKDDIVEVFENIYSTLNYETANRKKIRFTIDKKSDLYVYFFLRGLQLLKDKGVLCFICSNSWLDVGYGKVLQQVFLRLTRIAAIYDNSAKRSFSKADVNTTINVFVRDSSVDKTEINKLTKKKENINTENIARFVVFKNEFEKTATASDIQKIHSAQIVISNDRWRVYPIKQNELFKNGLDEESNYEGDKWGGKFLRAPDIFFTILEKGKDKLVRLGDIAEVRRGFTTGANEFFYLTKEKIKQWRIEEEFLKDVIKNPRELNTASIEKNDIKYKVLMFCDELKNLKGTSLIKYIHWGEECKFNLRPTCKSRKLWYCLEAWEYADSFWMETINDMNRVYFPSFKLYESDKFYGIKYYKKEEKLKYTLILNSTLISFFRELLGFASLGEGALKLPVYEVKSIYLTRINSEMKNSEILKRPMLSIFTELGFDKTKPIRSQKPNPLPDRKALDDIIFDALGLTKAEREEVYYAVCELVQNRLNKARSV